MSAFPALVLAVVLTYAFADVYRPYLPQAVAYGLDLIICIVIFKAAHAYLKRLKD